MATKDDTGEAAMMTAMLSGFVFAGLQNLDGVLTPPIEWLGCDPDGIVRFRLASGMLVTITIQVDPA